MSAGQPEISATGFDYQHNYRFRIAGVQQTGVVEMVQIGDSWYPATWNQYVYECKTRTGWSGSATSAPSQRYLHRARGAPITLAEIGQLSHQFPKNTFYLPDGCGGSISMVDTAYPSLTNPVPVMRSGG